MLLGESAAEEGGVWQPIEEAHRGCPLKDPLPLGESYSAAAEATKTGEA
jgi:hypothetical protein